MCLITAQLDVFLFKLPYIDETLALFMRAISAPCCHFLGWASLISIHCKNLLSWTRYLVCSQACNAIQIHGSIKCKMEEIENEECAQ